MKKLPSIILIAVLLSVLASLMVFMCLPIGQAGGNAVGGVMELGGDSLEKTIYQLNGEWEFYYGELLTPNDFTAAWRPPAEMIDIPSAWNKAGYPRGGFATYRLVVYTDNKEPLALFLPEIYSAYNLWVNGEIVRSAGVVSSAAAESSRVYENALVPIQAPGERLELVIQISNYDYRLSGMAYALLLGERDNIFSWFLRTRAFYCLALGCILMMVVYHLALFIFRPREKVYLFFSIMCLLAFLLFLLAETNSLGDFIRWRSGWIPVLRAYFFLYFLHSLTLLLFALFIFRHDFLLKHKYAALAYVAVSCLQAMFLPTNAHYTFAIQVWILLPPTMLTVVMALRSPVLREDKWSRLYFAALALYTIVGLTSKLFLENVWFMTGLLMYMFLIMAQSFMLSKKYAHTFEVVEETNANLERIVGERTVELVMANKSLATSEKSIRETVQAISHDLKTPLAVLGVHLEMTKEDKSLSPASRRHLEIAYNKHTNLSWLLTNLLRAVNIEEGRGAFNMGWASVEQFMLEMQSAYEDDAEAAEVALTCGLNQDCLMWIDSERIWSVFDNLISNALRYTPPGGEICVTACSRENEQVSISVKDTGCGIPAEHLPHIFEQFYMGDKFRSGNGLGLYIVKTLVEGMEGRVEARSKTGQGTEIIILLKGKLLKLF